MQKPYILILCMFFLLFLGFMIIWPKHTSNLMNDLIYLQKWKSPYAYLENGIEKFNQA